MTKHVTVTGSGDRVASLSKVFEDGGFAVVNASDLGPGTPPIDCYVQTGVVVPTRGETVIRRVHSFLVDGLLERFMAVERVLPFLADDAIVVLVTGNSPENLTAPDDREARIALLHVLAHAIRADRRVRVRVVPGSSSDAEVLACLYRKAADPGVPTSSEAEVGGRGYEDWRTAVLGLAEVEV